MYVDGMNTNIIYENNEKQISLCAEIVDGEVLFFVESDGILEHHSDFNNALKEYIELNIQK